MRKFLAFQLLLSLAGCTHVATIQTQDLAATPEGAALKGASYSLPAIRYDLIITRLVADCGPDGVPQFGVKAATKDEYVAGESFEIDPAALSSIFKTSSLRIEKHEDLNTLKSFNASADDKTAEIAVSVARAGLAIAGVPGGGPSTAAVVPEATFTAAVQTPPLTCSATAKNRLGVVKDRTELLSRLNPQLTVLATRIARLAELAKLRRFDARSMASLLTDVERLQELEALITNAKDDLEEAAKQLGSLDKFAWPNPTTASPSQAGLVGYAPFGKNPRTHRKFCRNFILTTENQQVDLSVLTPDSALDEECAQVLKLVEEATQVHLRFESETTDVAAGTYRKLVLVPPRDEPAKGIFYREPVRARLVVEHERDIGQQERVFTDDPRWVPQLGRLRFLPFESGPFENETLSLALRKDGRIESLGYETKDAALARAAAAAADIAEKHRADQEKREDRRRADEKYLRETAAAERADEIAKLQYEIDLLQKRKTLAESTSPDPTEVAAKAELELLNSEIALLTARINRLKLTSDLAELQSPPG